MRIAAIGYRDWALAIYEHLARVTDHTVYIVRGREEYSEQAILEFKPDIALFYGWSWKVGADVLKAAPCVMLHPSPLPKYRGGSPIQNQIINGETESAVTLFLMSRELDAGDIIAQRPISLEGHLQDILDRITDVGIEATMDILDRGYTPQPQDHDAATVYKRRHPEDSEITFEELTTKPGEYIYNKVRMLEDPYPNAFIRCADGRKLLLKRAEIE